MSSSAICLENVTFAYDDKVLFDDVSIAIPNHSFTAIIGDNGVGKTTLLNVMLGELPIQSGQVTIGGQPCQKAIKEQQVAYISQQSLQAYQQFPTSIEEVLEVHLAYLNKQSKKMDYLQMVNLLGHQHKKLSELSGGQLQRLGILLALVQDAPILLLDEPTNNIDVHFATELYALLERLVKQGKTIVMVTHHIHHALPYVDYVLEVSSGMCAICDREHYHVHGRVCEC
ncbi:ATP-binding cassette domain-containing protein [Carnobacteriaceae bacterium zg-C25]|nr:ATP-binding cassette domain-containing protein [Carnobacteriaceae bacterium zg-C25]